jgi:CheY-like chemotaxis protein/MinD-like ATPase involved in chromosome partitioning or flagellar assembly
MLGRGGRAAEKPPRASCRIKRRIYNRNYKLLIYRLPLHISRQVTAVTKKLTVLIVDDTVDNVRLMGLIFHRGGYEVYKAHTGQEALTKIETLHPHLVILDVMMPDMSGLEVCQRVRANPAVARTPIIMVSAKGLVDDRVSGLQAGADDYMAKPVDGSELLARAAALLTRVNVGQRPTARIIAFVGAKGGMGVSSTALNCAVSLVSAGKSVILAELADHVSWLRLSLDMALTHSLGDLMELNATDIDRADVTRCLVRHPTGLRMLLAPGERPPHPLSDAHVEAILDAISLETDFILMDLSSMTGAGAAAALQAADRILLVVEPELMAVACAHSQLESLKKWGLWKRTNLVLNNRTPTEVALSRAQVETQLNLAASDDGPRWPTGGGTGGIVEKKGGPKIIVAIPPAAEPMYEALRLREPLVISMPNLVVAKAFSDLANWISEAER